VRIFVIANIAPNFQSFKGNLAGEKHPLQRISKFTPLVCGNPGEILLLPPNGRQMLGLGDAKQRPIRFAAFEAEKKAPVFIRHVSNHCGDDCFPRGLKLFQIDGHPGNSYKTPLKLSAERFSVGSQDFRHRSIVADDIDEECPAQFIADALMGSAAFRREDSSDCGVAPVSFYRAAVGCDQQLSMALDAL